MMSRLRAAAALVLVSAGILFPASTRAQGKRRPAETPDVQPSSSQVPEMEELIARYGLASRPGPEHRWLEPLVGSWNLEAVWHSAAGRTVRTTGTSENRWSLGGRLLQCEALVGEGDSRIEALSLFGFDTRKKQFFEVVLHNLATYAFQPSGNFDPIARSFIFSGKERDEVTGRAFTYRQLIRIEGPDRFVVHFFVDTGSGAPLKLVEVAYTRR